MKFFFHSCLASLLALGLISCGSGSSEVAGIDGSGAPAKIDTEGTVDGFGSVIVNGVKYETSKADVIINGQSVMEDNLRTGYRVRIIGSIDNQTKVATADKIEFVPDLVGSISAIDLSSQQLTLLNQTVQITNRSLFSAAISPDDLRGLSVGDRVQISGVFAQNKWIAMRVDLSSDSDQIAGMISNINTANQTFSLNGISVNYAAALVTDINGNQLANNLKVSVRGQFNSDQLQASQIQGLNKNIDSQTQQFEREGVITRFASASDFDLNGNKLITNTQTRFENGTAADLKLGAQIEFKAERSSNDWLATSISFEQEDNNKLEGAITSIELATSGSNVIATGSIQIGSILIRTNAATRYEDKGDSQLRRFGLANLVVGDYLRVTGFTQGNDFIATKIERRKFENSDDEEFNFEGNISAVGLDNITLFGKTIQLTESTELRNAFGENINLATFLAIALNQNVEVRGTISAGIYTADKIEIEGED
jgi:hypothetical protein